MGLYFIVVGQTVDFGCVKINKDVMTVIDAVLVGRGGHSFALEISATNKTGIDVIGWKGNAANGLEIEIDEMPFDRG